MVVETFITAKLWNSNFISKYKMGIFVWNYLFFDCLVAIECVDHVSHFIKENFPIIVGCKVHMCSTCGICLHLNLVVVFFVNRCHYL